MAETLTANAGLNRRKLFWLSCISLTVTAMTFAIRAGILEQLNEDLGLNDIQLGWVNGMAFLGFPLAMVIFGYLYNWLGPKLIMIFAFVGHILGLVLTITAGGFVGLLVSTFFIGFANGSVEAACNPMIADMYEEQKTKWLNRFHVWFPGGIVIGALISKFMTDNNMGWEAQIGIMIVPTLIYGFMVFTTKFPKVHKKAGIDVIALILLLAVMAILVLVGTPNEFVNTLPFGIVGPLLLATAIVYYLVFKMSGRHRDAILLTVMMGLMSITATSELGTQQWVEKILGSSGASPMLILAMVTGLMAVGRYFAGPVIHALNPVGVLLMSAILTALGLYLMSQASGNMMYLSAIVFALGVCYFWPTMIGFTGEYIPRTGALGMSLVGAAGMFALTIWNPIIGGWVGKADDAAKAASEKIEALTAANATSEEILPFQETIASAGREVLEKLFYFPLLLIPLFVALFLAHKWTVATRGVTAND